MLDTIQRSNQKRIEDLEVNSALQNEALTKRVDALAKEVERLKKGIKFNEYWIYATSKQQDEILENLGMED